MSVHPKIVWLPASTDHLAARRVWSYADHPPINWLAPDLDVTTVKRVDVDLYAFRSSYGQLRLGFDYEHNHARVFAADYDCPFAWLSRLGGCTCRTQDALDAGSTGNHKLNAYLLVTQAMQLYGKRP